MNRILCLICCCLFPFAAMAKEDAKDATKDATIESRQASKQEVDSFDRFYLKQHPGKVGLGINFLITRTSPKKPWDIKAHVLSETVHGYKNLCKQEVDNFVYDARGWRAEAEHPVNHMVWLDAGTACKAQPYIELETPLPDVDVIDLLHHGDAVLKQSYILMRGNSDCSLIYLQSLKLVGVGTVATGNEEMFQFRYLGQQFIPVTLAVRRLGTEYTTWNMHCPIPQDQAPPTPEKAAATQGKSAKPDKRSSTPLR